MTATDAALLGRLGAHVKWANCEDRPAATRAARAAFEQRFLDEAGGDPARAEHLRKAYFARLTLAAAKARKRKPGRGDGNDGTRRLVDVTAR